MLGFVPILPISVRGMEIVEPVLSCYFPSHQAGLNHVRALTKADGIMYVSCAIFVINLRECRRCHYDSR